MGLARRVFMMGLRVQRMSVGLHLMTLTAMPLRRRHEADAVVWCGGARGCAGE